MTKPDAEAEKSMCFSSLKFLLMFFPSEEYRRDISIDKCSAASVELLEQKGTERNRTKRTRLHQSVDVKFSLKIFNLTFTLQLCQPCRNAQRKPWTRC